jgi:hypothetical protein
MMARLAAVGAIVFGALDARAEPMPSGAIGPVVGAVSGTGADAKRLGFGHYQFGLQASWQPTVTERSWAWSLRWGTMVATFYNGTAARIDERLRTVHMDLMLGMRYRPWVTPRRYLTARFGGQIMRANEPIPRSNDPGAAMQRDFIGGVASVGLDQYLGPVLLNVDVRYGLIGNDTPQSLSLLVGVGLAGP